MKVKLLSAAILAAGLLSATAAVQAAMLEFEGNFKNAREVASFEFKVDNSLGLGFVELYTDSYAIDPNKDVTKQQNFNPFLVLWDSTGKIIELNEDIDAANFKFDARIYRDDLADGVYTFTIGAWLNEPAGDYLSDGFSFPNGLSDNLRPLGWGNYWHVVIAGNVAAIPEPETWAMLLAGLGMVGAVARRRKQV